MSEQRTTMIKLMEKHLKSAGFAPTPVQGVGLFRRDEPYKKRPQLYNPQILILAQGKKNIYLGDQHFVYDEQHYYVQAVPLPVECEALIDEGKPMLGMVIQIEPQLLGEILYELDASAATGHKIQNSLYDAIMTDDIRDAVIRFLKSMDSKNEGRILGPMIIKEILFRILTGENGEILRELVINNRGFYQISKAISKIHEQFDQPIEIQSLAQEAGMSSTAFYTLFKQMTSTSPLQYIKNIRLHRAKTLIQQEGEKANIAATRVGYESSSQFSREYKRCFGISPSRDRQLVGNY